MHLRISDVVRVLQSVAAKHGDLKCFVYSTEQQRNTPMVEESISLVPLRSPPAQAISISAILPEYEQHLGLLNPEE